MRSTGARALIRQSNASRHLQVILDVMHTGEVLVPFFPIKMTKRIAGAKALIRLLQRRHPHSRHGRPGCLLVQRLIPCGQKAFFCLLAHNLIRGIFKEPSRLSCP